LKKYIAIIAAMLFVLGFAASAFAIHAEIPAETSAIVVKGESTVTLGGEIRMRGEFKERDFDSDSGGEADYDGRVRLGMDVKVGHMPLALGNKIFFNHTKFGDDAIVVYADPNKKVHIAALTIKLFEGDANVYDDADAYVALVKADLGNAKIGGDITYLTDESPETAGVAAPLPIPAGALERINLYNIGVQAEFNAGPVVIWVDGNYQSGTAEDNEDDATLTDDIDIAAHSLVVGAKMKAGAVNIALDGGYATGQDLDEDEDLNLFLTSLGAHGNAPLYTYVYDYRIAGASGVGQAGLSNTTYIAGRVSGKATKTISWKAQVVWLKATEEILNDQGDETDEIGTEIDGKIVFQLAKGLKYWIEGGYLSPGAVYDYVDDAGDDTDADAAYAIRNGIALNF
jgi:hypothetical protein